MHSISHIRILCTCLSIAVFAQCSAAQSIRPASNRLDAIVSYPLVIAIVADNERDLRSGVTTKLDDGRELESIAHWVGISPQNSAQGWTSSKGIWTATSYESIIKFPLNRRPIGSWFIRIPMPIDAVGQGLWIQGERYELNWLPDPERTILEAVNQTEDRNLDSFWTLHLPDDALQDRAIQAAIDQYHHDPFQNWRARLLTDGLNPDRARARDTSMSTDFSLEALDLELSMDTPGADLLRELARQHEARWQIILGRIWLLDTDVAYRLKSQLMRTARFGPRILPVWAGDTTELERLAHDLLSPFIDDRTRVLRANAWLDVQPRALAWITDDQGQIEAETERFIPTITTLSLPQSPGASLFRIDTPSNLGSSSPELSTISPYLATPLTIPIDPIDLAPSNPALETQSIRIRTGRWNATREVIASPTPARAPYVRIGPLLNDWTMDELLSNRPLAGALPSLNQSAVGILRRTATPTRDHPTAGWQLFIELTSSNPHSPNELLTLWIGPYTNPYAVWKIGPDGQVTFDAGSRPNIGIPHLQTRTLNDRWVAMIDLPRGAFDEHQVLQLGIERIDANNYHTAWPRRMIPDQPEPGRLSIEADNFDHLRPN
jgi:hypothetical protein